MGPKNLEQNYLGGFENLEIPNTQPHPFVAKATSFPHLMKRLSFCTNMMKQPYLREVPGKEKLILSGRALVGNI